MGTILESSRIELRLEKSEAAPQGMNQMGIAEFYRRKIEKDRPVGFLSVIDCPGRRSEAVKLGHILQAFLSGFHGGSESPERDP
jgi:hypothetical protein